MGHIRIRTSLCSGSYQLKTLEDFKLPDFELEDRTYYHDPEKRRALITFFCEQAGMRRYGEVLLDLLEEAEAGTADDEEIRAGMLKLAEAFECIGGGIHLGPSGYRTYLPGAEEAATMVPTQSRTPAWAHVLLYSLICATEFGNFPPQIRQALLQGFMPAECGVTDSCQMQWQEIRVDTQELEFDMRWDITPYVPPTPCRLINADRERRAGFTLCTPEGRQWVMIPAGGSLIALFSGQVMTCLKGNIQHRMGCAMIRNAQEGLDRMDLRSGRNSKMRLRGGALDDFIIRPYDELGVLRDNRLSIPGVDPLEDVMSIFAANDSWIAWMWDGRTRSDRPEQCVENVIAVVQDEDGIVVVDGQTSVEQRKVLMRRMLKRFDTGNEEVAEQIRLPGGWLRLTADNCLVWEVCK